MQFGEVEGEVENWAEAITLELQCMEIGSSAGHTPHPIIAGW